MPQKEITCIVCPMGCTIVVLGERDDVRSISQNLCERGREYAKNEFSHPVRLLTSTARIKESEEPLIPLRSSGPIPRELLPACAEEIKN